ncbi:TIGR01440 family protein [Bacillus carboniphilus]|uniref:UPF0340 protein LC087_12355 n=1 Tax=Bacillus carboniphilus TaxID=86663 RepID=A0ABY9JTN5_9BACI|nr:TIGR01440 family protein [Bacillus carboniphilus]WLR41658.1 TIGR01440 family protein [Bacillus carboniphilus]
MTELQLWKDNLQTILLDYEQQVSFKRDQLFVVGCSTSEVQGKRIGTAGAEEIAEMIYEELLTFSKKHHVYLAFQCCEHLNRAIVVEEEAALKYNLNEVTVVPVRSAGGSMATYAYRQFNNPVVVESIKAHGGMDIGDTFIGMHLRHVAVPIRVNLHSVGSAHVILATTRPKLIGGARAVYEETEENQSCT